MTLQARFNQADPRLYSIDRDVAHAFKPMVLEVADRLQREEWDIVTTTLDYHGITSAQLGATAEAFCKFVMAATEKRESMEECLLRSNWFDQPAAAQMAYMAILGTVVSGYFFAGVRQARCTGNDPVHSGDDLRAYGSRCAQAMARPKWRRAITALGFRIRDAVNALLGRTA